MKPIALTPGDPAGIGPDLVLGATALTPDLPVIVLTDPGILRERAERLGLGVEVVEIHDPVRYRPPGSGRIAVFPVPARAPVMPGRLDPANAAHVLATLEAAANGCLAGDFSAMVTAPVHKGVINDAGFAFSGHTEFLADHCGAAQPVMLLTCPALRVALVTTHLPLAAVPAAITRERVSAVIEVLEHDLRARFGIVRPRILVCGLNPHAGEGGHLGREDLEVIAPAVAEAEGRGLAIQGPLPADTAFTRERLEGADVVLTMYHDQGLPVLKYAGFGDAVNVTLGLPYIRTSVDHGTALELAATGRARPASLVAALRLAAELAGPPREAAA